MPRLKDTSLVLFFTRGVSLKTWHDVGMVDREVALYRALRPHLRSIIFVTYGHVWDLRYADRVDGIPIVCNRWRLPQQWYVCLLSHVYPLLWRGPVVFKSNQIVGADIALQAARRCGKKFIARCGYPYSDFTERQQGPDSREAQRARTMEQEVFAAADRVVVTTPAMEHTVVQRYKVPAERVAVIPNYVETDLFRPSPDGRQAARRICFIGRLDEQKNPFALLKAIKDLDVELLIVGNGALGDRLREEVNLHRLPVRFLGNVPHRRLPEILNSAALFILLSHYEGHPKALLEAMACGLPVIGTDVRGIRELIRHGVTGWLCGTDSASIRAAIQELLARPALRTELGCNARQLVVENFSLERVAETELEVLASVARE